MINIKIETIMRTILFTAALAILASSTMAADVKWHDSIVTLQKEVVQLFEIHRSKLPDLGSEDVTVGFMINAKKEIIVLDVKGNSTSACDYVKEVLNYKKVRYNQAKLLTPYTITIRLVNEKN